MKIVVGLGNPGLRYAGTRHNAGFMVTEHFAKKFGIRIRKRQYGALTGIGNIHGNEILFVMPQTYMNLSGEAVSQAKGSLESLDDLMVIYDDIDLPLGEIRFRPKGSSGGHKGMRSIIESLDTEDFPRLRVGIRPSGDDVFDTTDFVLRAFTGPEKKILDKVIKKCADGLEVWLAEGLNAAMTEFNGAD